LVAEWRTLDTELQRVLFRRAVRSASETVLLREQIARFLHDHEDDDTAARALILASTMAGRPLLAALGKMGRPPSRPTQ
jgi:hypothetical protein